MEVKLVEKVDRVDTVDKWESSHSKAKIFFFILVNFVNIINRVSSH
jgi:hypothetical protein